MCSLHVCNVLINPFCMSFFYTFWTYGCVGYEVLTLDINSWTIESWNLFVNIYANWSCEGT